MSNSFESVFAKHSGGRRDAQFCSPVNGSLKTIALFKLFFNPTALRIPIPAALIERTVLIQLRRYLSRMKSADTAALLPPAERELDTYADFDASAPLLM
jgi:hypothetical protein